MNEWIFYTFAYLLNLIADAAQKMKFSIKGTLMQMWKSANIFVFTRK